MTSKSSNAPSAEAGEMPRRPKKKLGRDIVRVISITVFFLIVALLLRSETVRHHLFDIATVRESLQNDGSFFGVLKSYAIFVLVATILIGLGMPRVWVAAVAGTIYGAFEGTVVAYIASLGGCVITYQLGRSVLRGVAKRRLKKHLKTWQKRIARNAFWWVIYGRLIPFMNATMMNLLFGVVKVPIKPYLAASAIGLLPLTVAFALFGSGAAKGNFNQIVIGVVMLALANGAYWLYRMGQKHGAKEAAGENA